MPTGTMWPMASTSDRVRTILVAVTAVAQTVAAPLTMWALGPASNIGAISDANISPVTPADYAFAVWGLIYAAVWRLPSTSCCQASRSARSTG